MSDSGLEEIGDFEASLDDTNQSSAYRDEDINYQIAIPTFHLSDNNGVKNIPIPDDLEEPFIPGTDIRDSETINEEVSLLQNVLSTAQELIDQFAVYKKIVTESIGDDMAGLNDAETLRELFEIRTIQALVIPVLIFTLISFAILINNLIDIDPSPEKGTAEVEEILISDTPAATIQSEINLVNVISEETETATETYTETPESALEVTDTPIEATQEPELTPEATPEAIPTDIEITIDGRVSIDARYLAQQDFFEDKDIVYVRGVNGPINTVGEILSRFEGRIARVGIGDYAEGNPVMRLGDIYGPDGHLGFDNIYQGIFYAPFDGQILASGNFAGHIGFNSGTGANSVLILSDVSFTNEEGDSFKIMVLAGGHNTAENSFVEAGDEVSVNQELGVTGNRGGMVGNALYHSHTQVYIVNADVDASELWHFANDQIVVDEGEDVWLIDGTYIFEQLLYQVYLNEALFNEDFELIPQEVMTMSLADFSAYSVQGRGGFTRWARGDSYFQKYNVIPAPPPLLMNIHPQGLHFVNASLIELDYDAPIGDRLLDSLQIFYTYFGNNSVGRIETMTDEQIIVYDFANGDSDLDFENLSLLLAGDLKE